MKKEMLLGHNLNLDFFVRQSYKLWFKRSHFFLLKEINLKILKKNNFSL